MRRKNRHYRANRNDAGLSMHSQTPCTRTNVTVEEHMNIVVIGSLMQIGSALQFSMDLLSSISNNVAIVTGQKKNLFVTEIINEDTGNGVRVRRVNSLANDASFGRMQDKLSLAR